jgi:putative membrane protein
MFGPGAFIFGVLIPLVVVALVIFGVWELARSRERTLADGAVVGGYAVSGTARSILDERFARGDVDTEEYVRRRALLDGTVPSPPQTVAQYDPATQYDPAAHDAVVDPAASDVVSAASPAASPVASAAPDTQEQPAADA